MKIGGFAARFALMASCSLMMVSPASAKFWQCVTYARSVSGIDLHGDAKTWWGEAQGRYERGHDPKVGAVLAFAASDRMRLGHVAMVSKVVSDREVLLDQANWSHPGQIETGTRAVDVSDAGDWSAVKVYYGPTGQLGTTVYTTKGFIYANGTPAGDDDDAAPAAAATVEIAAVQPNSGSIDQRGIFTLVNDTKY